MTAAPDLDLAHDIPLDVSTWFETVDRIVRIPAGWTLHSGRRDMRITRIVFTAATALAIAGIAAVSIPAVSMPGADGIRVN
jgi:hypothetical protein